VRNGPGGADAVVTTQRERPAGTLERLMAMPLGKLDLLAGYAIAFGLIAQAQVGVVLVILLTWLGVQLPGSVVPLVVIAVLDALRCVPRHRSYLQLVQVNEHRCVRDLQVRPPHPARADSFGARWSRALLRARAAGGPAAHGSGTYGHDGARPSRRILRVIR
jgi:hypothetical protein